MKRLNFGRFVAVFVTLVLMTVLVHAAPGDNTGSDAEMPSPEQLLEAVQSYGDTMLDKGRDRWGEKHSPLFAVILDRSDHSLIRPDKGEKGTVLEIPVLYNANMWGATANPPVNTGLYRVLDGLTEVTGREKYTEAVDASQRYFWTHCQDPYSGLMPWGEEAAWHLKADVSCTYMKRGAGRMHEPFPYGFFERSYSLGPEVRVALFRYAHGLWAYSFNSQEKALWNRHYHLDEWPMGQREGKEYPRLVGQFCLPWAIAYAQTEHKHYRRTMLNAIRSVITNSLRRCKDNGALPFGTAKKVSDYYVLTHNLQMINQLHRVAEIVPDDLAEKVRTLITRQEEVIVNKLPHRLDPDTDPSPLGFVQRSRASTLEPGDYRKKVRDREFDRPWNDPSYAYEGGLHKATSMNILQMMDYHEKSGHEGFLELAFKGLNLVHTRLSELDSYPDGFTVKQMAMLLQLMTRAYRKTGERKYLRAARRRAGDALTMFFDDGSALPRITAGKGGVRNVPGDAYAAGTYDAVRGIGGDDLMFALLELYRVERRLDD